MKRTLHRSCTSPFTTATLIALGWISAAFGNVPLLSGRATLGTLSLPYSFYVPPHSQNDPLPVILYLHGSGECGIDNLAQTQTGIGPSLNENPGSFPAIVVMPQAPCEKDWDEDGIDAVAIRALKEVMAKYSVDTRRIYLTGNSMGGYGAFSIGSKYSALFAAIIPISGGGTPAMAEKLSSMPIWIFHGALDFTVPVDESRTMVAAIQNSGNTHVNYTEYALSFHNVWDRTYSDPKVLQWLFAQKRDD